jgi:hypothetical protein
VLKVPELGFLRSGFLRLGLFRSGKVCGAVISPSLLGMVECYRMSGGGSTVVKYLPYHRKVEGFSPVVAVAAGSG